MNLVSTCPICHASVMLFKSVESFDETDESFWGRPEDKRERVHQDGAWVHFQVGGEDRLAFMINRSIEWTK